MRFAYIMAPDRGDVDLVLFRLADNLQQVVRRACDAVRTSTDCSEANPFDMDLRVLPDSSVIRISQ